MNLRSWAEREIELACAKNKKNDYLVRSNRRALEVFKMLEVDGEMSQTFDTLQRLYRGLPLSPITEEEFFSVEYGTEEFPAKSEEYLKDAELRDSRQCPRYSALFRDVDLEGNVRYHDIERAYCVNINDERDVFYCFLVNIVDELFPITMPYMPTDVRYKVYVEYFLLDPKNGYADHHRVVKVETPQGEVIPVDNYYWREVGGERVRCTKEEWDKDASIYAFNYLTSKDDGERETD